MISVCDAMVAACDRSNAWQAFRLLGIAFGLFMGQSITRSQKRNRANMKKIDEIAK